MLQNEKTIAEYVALADAYKAIGSTSIYLYQEPDDHALYGRVTKVEEGGSWRLGAPSSARVHAEHECGLTFTWSVEFEGRDANGTGASRFDRGRLREFVMKLPPAAVKSFSEMLAKTVLPAMATRTEEIRTALNRQLDSEDCIRGIIAFATPATRDAVAESGRAEA